MLRGDGPESVLLSLQKPDGPLGAGKQACFTATGAAFDWIDYVVRVA